MTPPHIRRMNESHKWYEEDSKLPHVTLKDILYFDEEENRFIKATLEVFGRCSETVTLGDHGEVWKSIKNMRPKDAEVVMSVSKDDDGDGYFVTMDDHKYYMPPEEVSLLSAYLDGINKPITDRRASFRSEVILQRDALKEDSSIRAMCHNLLSGISPSYFMDRELIAGIELMLEDENMDGKMLFVSTEELRASIVHQVSKTEGNTTRTTRSIDRHDVLSDYHDNHFGLLAKVIEKRYGYGHLLSLYVTHTLLMEIATEYYSDLWKKEYGHLFVGIASASLEELVVIYLSIDAIQHTNLVQAGRFVYFLMRNGKLEHSTNYIECSSVVFEKILAGQEERKIANFENKLLKRQGCGEMSIDLVDMMNGEQFEAFVADMFARMGYETEITKQAGDQGIDVLAGKNQVKIGIQAKCYSGVVGNSAIQEAVAGIKYYGCDRAIVVTNSRFTKSAIELAVSNDVVLWDRDMLKEKIAELF